MVTAFVEGLAIMAVHPSPFESPRLLIAESTGMWGLSSVRILDVLNKTHPVLRKTVLPAANFGEGLAVWRGLIFQLTYQSSVIFVYNATTLQTLFTIDFPENSFKEGWGLAVDSSENEFYVTDGSSTVYVLELATWPCGPRSSSWYQPGGEADAEAAVGRKLCRFRVIRRLQVMDGRTQRPVVNLNDIAFDPRTRTLWANIHSSACMAHINASSGAVIGWLDGAELQPKADELSHLVGWKPTGTMNGVTIDAVTGHLFMTGKCWPYLYELEVFTQTTLQGRGSSAQQSLSPWPQGVGVGAASPAPICAAPAAMHGDGLGLGTSADVWSAWGVSPFLKDRMAAWLT